jgi:hypothetical protein
MGLLMSIYKTPSEATGLYYRCESSEKQFKQSKMNANVKRNPGKSRQPILPLFILYIISLRINRETGIAHSGKVRTRAMYHRMEQKVRQSHSAIPATQLNQCTELPQPMCVLSTPRAYKAHLQKGSPRHPATIRPDRLPKRRTGATPIPFDCSDPCRATKEARLLFRQTVDEEYFWSNFLDI